MSDKKEYIEREAVLNEQMEICHWDGLNDSYDDFVAVKDILAIPAADVEEVRHGRWLPYPSDAYMKCSVCGMEYHKSRMPDVVGYCPNPQLRCKDGRR